MKYIDDNDEVQKYNIKDLAKTQMKSELTKYVTAEKRNSKKILLIIHRRVLLTHTLIMLRMYLIL